jgi:superfamily II RNA helicase
MMLTGDKTGKNNIDATQTRSNGDVVGNNSTNHKNLPRWCETNGSKEVYLCSTHHRVVPLGHYGFLTTNEGLYKGMNDEDKKREIRNEMNKPNPSSRLQRCI